MYLLYYSLFFAYLAFVIYTFDGWKHLKILSPNKTSPSTFISLIVSFRNEEQNLKSFIESIEKQDYPKELFELILIDDHSEDQSVELIQTLTKESSFDLKILSLPEGLKQKKAAISFGVENAKGELIVTTDCDTSRSKAWLSSMASFYEAERPTMIIAPVLMENGTSFLQKFQAIEFLSLQWVTATYCGQNNAILCNGANLAFTKQIFEELGAYKETPNVVSGDDFFLMLKMKKKRKGKISYIRDQNALVKTKTEESWNSFSQQRLRWAAKSKYAGENTFYLTGIYNTLLSIFLIVLPFLEFDQRSFPFYTLTFWALKLLGDWFMLNKMARFFDVKMPLYTFLLSFFLYPFYICHTFIQTLYKTPTWKGRSI